MPVIRRPDELRRESDPGWTRTDWAGPAVFGADVPMRARRYQLDPGCDAAGIELNSREAFVYVIAGAGSGRPEPAVPPGAPGQLPPPGQPVAGPGEGGESAAGSEEFALARESVLWLGACRGLCLSAGPDGLDALVAESTWVGGEPTAPLRKVFGAAELPHLVSTRDTRDRLDLVTDDVPVGAEHIRADRIVYHPGDTAAAHYHADCHHVFCVLSGSGLLYSGERSLRLEAGASALVGPGEEHWFENDTGAEFSFVEFWAPLPTATIWTVAQDRCTWAPAG